MQALSVTTKLESGQFNFTLSWPPKPFARLLRRFHDWKEKRQTMQRILDLDAHMLRDIGLDERTDGLERQKQFRVPDRHPML